MNVEPLSVTIAQDPARVLSTCTVESLFHVEETGIRSGIGKIPRAEGIKLLTHGVLGDVQGDTEQIGRAHV